MNPRIAVIIVTYNRKQLLCECLTAVLESDYTDYDVYVIDNASTDGTEEILTPFLQRNNLYYRNTGSNLGGAGGFHYGMKAAGIEKYKYLWLMDDDTVVQSDTMRRMIMFMEDHSEFAFSTGKVLWKDGTMCAMNIPKITKWRPVKNFEKRQRVQYASFVALMLRAEVVERVGLPYKEFFIWGDDCEYTRRISKRYPCVYLPEAVSEHKSENNNGSNIEKCSEDRLERYSYMYRNEVVVYRQDGIEGLFYLVLRVMLHTVRILFKCNGKKLERLNLMYHAFRFGLDFSPKIEYIVKNVEEN